MIPIFKPHVGADEIEALIGVAKSGSFILGKEVEDFENEFAAYVKAQHAVGVASGTDALILSLEALGVSAGDEVICPAWSFYATSEAISRVGATPVFVDIDHTYNIDPAKVSTNTKTKAIIAVHQYGYPAAIEQLKRHGLPIIVDSAQALTDHEGLIGCYSFFPSKILGGCGDGGMVATNDREIAEKVRILRVHGQKERWNFTEIGYNSRLDAIQAGFLRVKLRKVQEAIEKRKSLAARYNRELAGDVTIPNGHNRHTWGVYTIQSPNRDELQDRLKEVGIASAIHYPTPLPGLLVYRRMNMVICPVAERAASRVLSLPIYPELEYDEQTRVIEVVREHG